MTDYRKPWIDMDRLIAHRISESWWYMRITHLICIALLVLPGCQNVSTKRVDLFKSWNSKDVAHIHEEGVNTIKGSALIRQRRGTTVTCAGQQISLIPDSPYARERMRHLYGSLVKGFRPVGQKIQFSPDFDTYIAATRKTTGDTQGFFTFEKVPDGSYFVVTTITWAATEYLYSGGGLMKRVDIKGGQTKSIVLTP
jgi:hypothetical protein